MKLSFPKLLLPDGNVVYLNREYQALSDIVGVLQRPEGYLKQGKILKQDPTSTVSLIEMESGKYVLKQHKMRTRWIALKYSVCNTRAYKCWKNTHMLHSYQVPTPRSVGFVEKRFGPFKGTSFYLYEYKDGIDCHLLSKEQGFLHVHQAEAIVKVVKRLKQNRLTFRDMKATNFIFSNDQPFLIDTHSVKQHTVQHHFLRRHHRDVLRFMHCWRNSPREKALFNELFEQHGIKVLTNKNYHFPDE